MYKTDVFIPWTPSSSFVGPCEELKYCLRSVSLWWPVQNIHIVSECPKPDWVQNVAWHKVDPAVPYEKEAQIKIAIEHAINQGISDPFLYINDDQYLLDNQCIAWIQHLVANQPCPDLSIKTSSKWMQMTIDTLAQLKSAGYPYNNWCTHMPWLVQHASYKRAKEFFGHYMWQLESGVMNLQTRCWPLFITELPGLRLQFTEHKTDEHFTSYTSFLNHNDNGIERSWYLIRKLFPDKSRYEK